MANEISVSVSLQINNGNLQYQSRPTAYQDDQGSARGATPGLTQVSTSGTDIDFSKLTTPGYCWLQNLDSTNYVTLGVYEPDTDFFYPVIELPPGAKPQLFKLSRFLVRESTGTGTLVGYNSRLQLRANGGICDVRVDCFEA